MKKIKVELFERGTNNVDKKREEIIEGKEIEMIPSDNLVIFEVTKTGDDAIKPFMLAFPASDIYRIQYDNIDV